jgi:hypothetical protein
MVGMEWPTGSGAMRTSRRGRSIVLMAMAAQFLDRSHDEGRQPPWCSETRAMEQFVCMYPITLQKVEETKGPVGHGNAPHDVLSST